MMLTIKKCPICFNESFEQIRRCKDYTTSHETFIISSCKQCGLKLTNPRPDDADLGKYYQSAEYISHTGKATNAIDKLYLLARNLTLRKKLALINRLKPNHGKVLDYGCGTGEFINVCKTNGWEISGLEPSNIAREKSSTLNQIEILKSLDEIKDSYDIITLWHVLEHVPNLDHTLTILTKALKEKGTMFIAVPNYESSDAKHYQEYWAAYDVPRHLWHFDKKTMERLLAKYSLNIIQIKPMKLDSFYVSMLSEIYKRNGKRSITGLMSAFINGLKSNTNAITTGNYSSLIYIIQK